ncbi:ribonuclease H-like domain-containing protein [Tanacetum coccineum]
MYENFSAPSTESLDSSFNMLQKIVSQLAILGENILQDLNVKFLRSLPSMWNTYVVVWRNKLDLDTMSFDDLYNNFKIVKQEVKGTASSSSQNMAFVSSPSSTNKVNTAYGVSTANTQVSPASTQVSTASTQVSTANLISIAEHENKKVFLENWRKITINGSDTAGYDKSKMMKSIQHGLLMGFSDSENEVLFCEQLVVLKRDISYKDSEISMLKSELENLKQEKESNQLKIEKFDNASKSLDKLIGSQIPDKSRKGLWFPEFEGYGPKNSKSVSKDTSNKVRETHDAPLVEELVSNDKLEKKTDFPTVAKINFVRPKQQEKSVRKPVKPKAVNTARTKVVNTARPNTTVVNDVRENQVNTGHPQKEDQGYVNSGCSRHMTGNMSYLSDFKEFDGGYTFGGGAKGGKITSKGTLKTDKLDFEDVYFFKELQFNLFSVSQMCDKKNSVLFINTRCFVLSPDFKLADESQVLLKVPKNNNMYSVDMKNIIPKKSLTCLVTKDTLDELMLWHRRLGIKREFNIARTPQQNGVAKRRNRTLIKDARTMLADSKLPTTFWAEEVNTACYVHNRVLVVKPYSKTPYELFRGTTPTLDFMRPFGCHVTILNTLDYLGKFDGKSDDRFFVGYSLNSKAFRVYNIRTRKVEENLHIRFLEDKPIIAGDGPKWLFDIDVLTKSVTPPNWVAAE